MVMKLTPTPLGTRALQRLVVTPPPPVRPAALRVGVDPVEKRRVAQSLLDGHSGAVRARVALHRLVGSAPPLAEPTDDVRRPRPGAPPVSPDSAVGEWLASRAQVIAQGPQGTG